MNATYKQFDLVTISTTKNIFWLRHPVGVVPSPHGIWSIVAITGTDLLVAKRGISCKVPIGDVVKVAEFDNSYDAWSKKWQKRKLNTERRT